MNTSVISVIVPVYKVEQYLNQCVQSIVDQTYSKLEIILVDDGSPDKCPEICDEWARKDSRIKVIHKENGGLSSARNAGIDVATGDYITFVDSDDYIDEKMYEQLLYGFSDKNVGIVSCGVLYDKNGEISIYNKEWIVKSKRVVTYNDFGILLLSSKVNYTVWSKIFKRELLDKVRFQLNKLNEDSLFVFDLSFVLEDKKINMVEIPFNGYYYRYTVGSITNNRKKPLTIDIIQNYENMSNTAYLRHHVQLGKTLMQYRNYKLFHFLFQIMNNKDYHVYFKDYYLKFKHTPLLNVYYANHLKGFDVFRLLVLRCYPKLYMRKYDIKEQL